MVAGGKPVIAILVFITAGWMLVDGLHAVVTGDFVTPGDGEYKNQLGPWAMIPHAFGIDARSTSVKVAFVVFGCAYFAALVLFLYRDRSAPITICALVALLYLPFGTLASAIVLATLWRMRLRSHELS